METLRKLSVIGKTKSILLFLGVILAGPAFATHTNVGPYESQEVCWSLGVNECFKDAEETCRDNGYYGEPTVTKTDCREFEPNSGIFYMHCYFRCVKAKVPGRLDDISEN